LQATECNKCHSRVLWTQCSLTSLVFFVRWH
jgi:ribosomal protein L40E